MESKREKAPDRRMRKNPSSRIYKLFEVLEEYEIQAHR